MQSAAIVKPTPVNPLYRNMPKLGGDAGDTTTNQGIYTIAEYIEWCQGRSIND